MNLQNLIDQKYLVTFEVSPAQIKGRFTAAMNYLDSAKRLFGDKSDDTHPNVIYSNLYTSARNFCLTLLFLNGYKTSGKRSHHITTLSAASFLLDDSTMDNAFERFERMRSKRTTIEYGPDLIEISEQDIEQAIDDIQQLANKLDRLIRGQQKLI